MGTEKRNEIRVSQMIPPQNSNFILKPGELGKALRLFLFI